MSDSLPKGNTVLSQDERSILSISWGPGGSRVGDEGVTRIEAYDENGHMASIPWVAVFIGDEIGLRISAEQVCIRYALPSPDAAQEAK